MKLVKYEAAKRALAVCLRVDEVKRIRDQALAMKLYGQLAKDERMVRDASAIHERSVRRLGEVMTEQARTVGKAKGGAHQHKANRGKRSPDSPATLDEAGIDKDLAKKARKAAAIPEAAFEKMMDELRNPPPKSTQPKAKRKSRPKVIDIEVASAADTNHHSFIHNAEWAAELAHESEYPDLVVDDAVLAAARSAETAWARCVKQLEERHGKAKAH